MKYLKSIFEYFDTFKMNNYFSDREFCTKFGACLMPEWEESLSDEERNAIEWYRDAGYKDAAEYLVKGENKLVYDYNSEEKKPVKYFVDHILTAVNRITLKKDIITYKGITTYKGVNVSLLPVLEKLKVGDNFQFKTLVSTTLHYKYAFNAFARYTENPTILKFKLHKGDHAAYISLKAEDGSRAENEILIHPNTKFKVSDIFETHSQEDEWTKIKVNVIEFTSI